MPIYNQNMFDAPALAAEAGKNVPYLNLENHGVQVGNFDQEYVKAAQFNQTLAESYAGLFNSREIAKMQVQNDYLMNTLKMQNKLDISNNEIQGRATQGDLDRQNALLMNQNTNAIHQQAVNQAGQFQQGMLGYRAGELQNQQSANANTANYQQAMIENAQKNTQINQAKQDLQSKLAMSKQDQEERLAAAGTLASLYNDPKLQANPQALNDQLNQMADQLHSNGKMSDDEFKQFTQADPQTKHTLLMYDMATGQKAQDITATSMSAQLTGQPLNKDVASKVQQKVLDLHNQDQHVQQMFSDYNPKFFTYLGRAAEASGKTLDQLPSWVQSVANTVPGFNTKDASAEAAKAQSFQSDINTAKLDILNTQAKNGRFNQNTLNALNNMVPDLKNDSPQTAQAKMQAIAQLHNQLTTYSAYALAHGVPVSQQNTEIQNLIQNTGQKMGNIQSPNQPTGESTTSSKSETSSNSLPKSINYKGIVYNMDEVKKIANANKISVDEVLQRMQQ